MTDIKIIVTEAKREKVQDIVEAQKDSKFKDPGKYPKTRKHLVTAGTVGADPDDSQVWKLSDESKTKMNEVDEHGWAHVHHAAFRGYLKSLEKFVKTSEGQLELETEDELHSTPLLLSVMSGTLETVKFMVLLGGNVGAINSQNHGVVELCAFKQFIEILQYFIELDHEKVPVWKHLIKFLASDLDAEAEAAAKCLRVLTQRSNEELHPQWKPAFDNGIVPSVTKVIKGGSSDEAKIETFWILLNMIERDEVKDQYLSSGGLNATVKHLKGPNNMLVMLAARTIKELCVIPSYSDHAAQAGAIPALTKVLQTNHDPEVLVESVDALGNIAAGKDTHQTTIGTSPGALSSLIGLFQDCVNKSLLMGLTRAVAKISRRHEANQNLFINEGVAPHIITLTKVKNKDLQLNAVVAIHGIAEGNPTSQKHILEAGVVMPLMQLLKKSRQPNLQEKTAEALWALAGDDAEERRSMASLMGVGLLIEFLTSLTENLHYIGSEGLGVLAQGPLSKQSAIAHANGVHPLVRLLRSDKEHIVLSVIRTMRHLCVGVGYIPHTQNQTTISQARGIKFLVAMMAHSKNELIQVEAAHSLGCLALGSQENLDEIHNNLDFSYIRILKMMYSRNEMVRLLAGAALAAFAYNSLNNQKDVAEQGGVRFSCFVPFLQSEDEYFRCNAAFQRGRSGHDPATAVTLDGEFLLVEAHENWADLVSFCWKRISLDHLCKRLYKEEQCKTTEWEVVVLARIIPDEEQAISSAAGIKLLVDLLHDSKSDDILALAADCIARLAHTRAGVPSAFVSIDTVNMLCDLLLSPAEQVRGCSAIALGYLSYNHAAERQLLNRCRTDPYLMKLMTHFNKKGKLSQHFMEEWKHYQKVGLPPIDEGRAQLVGKKSVHYKDSGRPMTIQSLDDTGASTNLQSSPSNAHGNTDEDKSNLTGRSSRSSRITNHSSGSLHQSQVSLVSSRRQSGYAMTDNLAPEIAAEDG